MTRTIRFEENWSVFQDHYDLAEDYGIFHDLFDHCRCDAHLPETPTFQPDEWRRLPMLGHLQTLLSDDPHYGPEMRLYNAAPWWYRRAFDLAPEEIRMHGALRFEGVDYYCKVWLNGEYLGEHEGYATAFEFEVGHLLKEHNVIYVKVWSPLDFARIDERDYASRCLHVIRTMAKGTYEHGDSLIHRDRNPVGIWRPVTLELYDSIRLTEQPRIDAIVNDDGTAKVRVQWTLRNSGGDVERGCTLRIHSLQSDWESVQESGVIAPKGTKTFSAEFVIEKPELWHTWDRGPANLYRLALQIEGLPACEVQFGVRKAEMVRTEEETYFVLNGKRLYVRGSSYYPETYLSTMTEGRYVRDMTAAKRMGLNMVRVHVHQEKPEFYRACDEMGIAVMQDTDFNWVHPHCDQWTARFLRIVEAQERALHNHPSILSWVCLNEPVEPGQEHQGSHCPHNRFVYDQPGPQLYAMLSEKAPGCALIRGSFCENDLLSGDSHTYVGSIYGNELNYEAIDGTKEKFNTEFGFDAPPESQRLWRERRVFNRLNLTAERLGEIQAYQYQYLKYFMEHYRLDKYAPNSGYMSFMLIDCSPSTFYGALDYDGCEKPAMRAYLESSQPVAIVMKRLKKGQELYIVNDLLREYPDCRAGWRLFDAMGNLTGKGSANADVPADGIVKIADIDWDGEKTARIELWLCDAAGNVIARNAYVDPFHPMKHPAGHPHTFSHTLGLRLY